MQSREKWLRERKTYIGGSDIGAIARFNAYKTPLDIYTDKTSDEIDLSTSSAAKWGIRLEDDVAEEYAEETGLEVVAEPNLIRHPQYPFLAANIDRWVDGKKFILECKTSSPWNIAKPEEEGHPDKWGKGRDAIPMTYLCQVAFYAAICDVPKVDIAVFFTITDFRIYTYERNRDLENKLIKIGCDFWNNHVLKRVPPPIVTLGDCSLRYPRSTAKAVTADSTIEAEVARLRQLKAEEKTIKDKMDNAQLKIKSFMQENEAVLDSSGAMLAQWKRGEGVGRFTLNRR